MWLLDSGGGHVLPNKDRQGFLFFSSYSYRCIKYVAKIPVLLHIQRRETLTDVSVFLSNRGCQKKSHLYSQISLHHHFIYFSFDCICAASRSKVFHSVQRDLVLSCLKSWRSTPFFVALKDNRHPADALPRSPRYSISSQMVFSVAVSDLILDLGTRTVHRTDTWVCVSPDISCPGRV